MTNDSPSKWIIMKSSRKANQYKKYDKLFTIKVDNISYNTSIHQIRELFSKYGKIGDIYMPRCAGSPKPQGYAFVRYHDKSNAVKATESLNETELQGRKIFVSIAQLKKSRPNAPVYNPPVNVMTIKDNFKAASRTEIDTISGSSPLQHEEAILEATDYKDRNIMNRRASNRQSVAPVALHNQIKQPPGNHPIQKLMVSGSDKSSAREDKCENQRCSVSEAANFQTMKSSFAGVINSLNHDDDRDNDRASVTEGSSSDGRRSPALSGKRMKSYDHYCLRASSCRKRLTDDGWRRDGKYYRQVFHELKRQKMHDTVSKAN